jgi:predicted Zn-dependent peptidase
VSLAERPPLPPLPARPAASAPAPELPPLAAPAPPPPLSIETASAATGLRIIRVPHPSAVTVTLDLGFPALADARRQGMLAVARQLVRQELVKGVPSGADGYLLDFGAAWSLEVVAVPGAEEKSLSALAAAVRAADDALEDFDARRLSYLQSLVSSSKSYTSIARNLARIGRYGASHPWAQGPATRVNALAAIEREEIAEVWGDLFDVGRAALVAVGPPESLPSARELRAAFSWARAAAGGGDVEAIAVPPARPEEGHRFHAMWFREEQVRMEAMYVGPAPTHPDYPAFVLLQKVFGSGFRSESNRSLRHDRGATYGVGSSLVVRREASELHWGGWVDPREGITLFEVHRDRVRALLEEGIAPAALAQARAALMGARARRLEDPENVAEDLARCAVVGIPPTHADCLFPPITEDARDVMRVAREYLDPSRGEWSMVGTPDYVSTRMQFEGTIYRYELERAGD